MCVCVCVCGVYIYIYIYIYIYTGYVQKLSQKYLFVKYASCTTDRRVCILREYYAS